jgi:hypothetical protein
MASHALEDSARTHSSLCALPLSCPFVAVADIKRMTCTTAAVTDIGGVMLGVHLMRNRKPFNMRTFTIAHNLLMFCASLYMVVETVRQVSVRLGSACIA